MISVWLPISSRGKPSSSWSARSSRKELSSSWASSLRPIFSPLHSSPHQPPQVIPHQCLPLSYPLTTFPSPVSESLCVLGECTRPLFLQRRVTDVGATHCQEHNRSLATDVLRSRNRTATGVGCSYD